MNDAHHRLFEEAKAKAEDRVESGLQRYHISLSPTLFLILCAEREKVVTFLKSIAEEDYRGNSNPHQAQAVALLKEIES